MSDSWSPQPVFGSTPPLAFSAGFAGRHDDIGDALRRAFAPPPGFAPTAPGRPEAAAQPPRHPEPAADGPRHFHPADREVNPTEGWDPFAAAAAAPELAPDTAHAIAAARAEGYEEGLRVAGDEATAAQARDRRLMDELTHALARATWVDRERFARQMRQTVLALVGQLVGEAGVSGEKLAARIDAAVDLLTDSAESAMLRLNPADMALVEGRLPKTVFPVADATIARGAFSLEAASTIVEDGPDRWIEQLTQAIDQVPLPTC
ncbi:FliH/SctL family protein [Sphingomonas sp.]|uniref:FliH/SctL family protein n=1 Tax=Sphingomonas sp. TaxID=28214 RepID=UPI002BFF80FF|nr:FliH/SctL family protein [Sphingomonas sp.]HTG37587.1 FliH/SctL family protein [Sphingomonas sp.]